MKTIKVRTYFIPVRCNYFTVGKIYSAKPFSDGFNDLYLVVSDDDKEHIIYLSCCSHLDERAWEVVDDA